MPLSVDGTPGNVSDPVRCRRALPRGWLERLYDIQRWTPMPRGGHFAAAEAPELLAADIAGFFAAL